MSVKHAVLPRALVSRVRYRAPGSRRAVIQPRGGHSGSEVLRVERKLVLLSRDRPRSAKFESRRDRFRERIRGEHGSLEGVPDELLERVADRHASWPVADFSGGREHRLRHLRNVINEGKSAGVEAGIPPEVMTEIERASADSPGRRAAMIVLARDMMRTPGNGGIKDQQAKAASARAFYRALSRAERLTEDAPTVIERPAEFDVEPAMAARAILPTAAATVRPVAGDPGPRPEDVSRMRMLKQVAEDGARLEIQAQRAIAWAEDCCRRDQAVRRRGYDGLARRSGLPGLGGM